MFQMHETNKKNMAQHKKQKIKLTKRSRYHKTINKLKVFFLKLNLFTESKKCLLLNVKLIVHNKIKMRSKQNLKN